MGTIGGSHTGRSAGTLPHLILEIEGLVAEVCLWIAQRLVAGNRLARVIGDAYGGKGLSVLLNLDAHVGQGAIRVEVALYGALPRAQLVWNTQFGLAGEAAQARVAVLAVLLFATGGEVQRILEMIQGEVLGSHVRGNKYVFTPCIYAAEVVADPVCILAVPVFGALSIAVPVDTSHIEIGTLNMCGAWHLLGVVLLGDVDNVVWIIRVNAAVLEAGESSGTLGVRCAISCALPGDAHT